jgi:hypothetical protein
MEVNLSTTQSSSFSIHSERNNPFVAQLQELRTWDRLVSIHHGNRVSHRDNFVAFSKLCSNQVASKPWDTARYQLWGEALESNTTIKDLRYSKSYTVINEYSLRGFISNNFWKGFRKRSLWMS